MREAPRRKLTLDPGSRLLRWRVTSEQDLCVAAAATEHGCSSSG